MKKAFLQLHTSFCICTLKTAIRKLHNFCSLSFREVWGEALTILLFFTLLTPILQAQIITTIAGGGTSGIGDGGPALNAELYYPTAIAIDGFGNKYITDRGNNRIRKVDTAGIITTFAGTGVAGYSGDNGPATNAKINSPYGIAIDKSNNIYFADGLNNVVRKINTGGIISTIAGTGGIGGYNGDNIEATNAKMNEIYGLAIDKYNNIYVGDGNNSRIRKIDTLGIITTIAGTGTPGFSGDNGQATAAKLRSVFGIVTDTCNNIYFTDYDLFIVRKISTEGIITTIAGTGIGGYNGDSILATNAKLFFPVGISIDSKNNIYICDGSNRRIRKVNITNGDNYITTIAGTCLGAYNGDGILATNANIGGPSGVTLDVNDNIYIADITNNRIRFIKNTESVYNIKNQRKQIELYPNPNSGMFTLVTNIKGKVKILITNVIGNTIYEYILDADYNINLDLHLPKGTYFLSLISTNEFYINKLIIN